MFSCSSLNLWGAQSVNPAITPRLLALFCPELRFSVGSASKDGRPSSKLRDGNQTGCLGACGSLNYFCLEAAACAGRVSGLRANALVCRAFCHAHFSTLRSITNEMLSVRWPAGFQPAVSLFITSSCSAQVLLFSSSILVGWRHRSKAWRTLIPFSRLYVETHIVANLLRRLCKGSPFSAPASYYGGSDKVTADLCIWIESSSCCWVPALMSSCTPRIQHCDSTNGSLCQLAV